MMLMTVDNVNFGGFDEEDMTVPTSMDVSRTSIMDQSVEVARAGATVPDESFAVDDMQVDIGMPEDSTLNASKGTSITC